MGSHHLNKPVVGISTSTDGTGYRLVASDGGSSRSAMPPFAGSMGDRVLNKPVVSTANDTNTGGYWEVALRRRRLLLRPAHRSSARPAADPWAAPVVSMAETANAAAIGRRLRRGDLQFRRTVPGLDGWLAPQPADRGHGRVLTPIVIAFAGRRLRT